MCLYDFDGKKASNQCSLLVLFLYFVLAGQINLVFLFLSGAVFFPLSFIYLFVLRFMCIIDETTGLLSTFLTYCALHISERTMY